MSRLYELPTDHLASSTQDGHRVYLYPADVRGRLRRIRTGINTVLILVFLSLPWIRIGGRPAILLNLPERKFAILGIQFWAHDVPMLFFVIAGAVLSIAFVTSVWGRVWCGYACPQTVFIDGVFRRLERWIEGDSWTRRKRDASALTASKLGIKAIKWSAFALVSLVIGHSFLAYFVGTEAIGRMMSQSPLVNPGAFGVMAFISGLVLFDFGWFREQFCIVACPYGRLQSVLMDDRSMVVGYDAARGEPRGEGGDCVNCYRCVAVCPTGVDIRRGTQMECIACTACMDACDEVMTRTGRPTGLIRYTSVSALKPRSFAYAAVLLMLAGGLTFTLSTRSLISAELVRAIEAPYQVIPDSDGVVRVTNHFKLDVRNQDFKASRVRIELAPESLAAGVELVTVNPEFGLSAGELRRVDVFFKFPTALLRSGSGRSWLNVGDRKVEVRLVGPFS